MAQDRRKRTTARGKAATAWRGFWQSPEGKLAIGALMARFSVYGGISSDNATQMAVAVGERNVCAWIAEQIGMKPEEYVDARNDFDNQVEKLIEQYGG